MLTNIGETSLFQKEIGSMLNYSPTNSFLSQTVNITNCVNDTTDLIK